MGSGKVGKKGSSGLGVLLGELALLSVLLLTLGIGVVLGGVELMLVELPVVLGMTELPLPAMKPI